MHSPKRVLFLDLVLTLFRLNGLLIAEGDAMTKDLGLTHARWKVIGAIALSNAGLTSHANLAENITGIYASNAVSLR